ncbi:MAG: hypothetical protein LR011_11425 [Verrucomicrobia bacterium]|nr:hypothetical protein [Verrucomicrobiota bacterium]
MDPNRPRALIVMVAAVFCLHAFSSQAQSNQTQELFASVRLDTTSDLDKDGLSDGFEQYQTGTSISLLDSDGDGIDDFEEIFKGLNALNIVPVLTRTLELIASLKIDTTPDQDQDLLSDGFETRIVGTHPLTPDTDFNGISDFSDLLNGDNPFFESPKLVTTSRNAFAAGFRLDTTDDSDQDGLSDGFENNVSITDFRLVDTDKDGASDGIEVFNNTNPLDESNTGVPVRVQFGIRSIDARFITLYLEGTGRVDIILYSSSDLKKWSELTQFEFNESDSFKQDIQVPIEFLHEFFRVVVNPRSGR